MYLVPDRPGKLGNPPFQTSCGVGFGACRKSNTLPAPPPQKQIPDQDLQQGLPTPHPHSPGPHTFGKVPSQTRGAPGASEPELYKIIGVRGPPFLHPPFLCRKTRETISYDQNYAELVEICPVSQLVSRAPAGVPLWPGATAGVLGPCGPGATAGVPAGLPPSLPALFVSRFAE